MDEDAAEVGFKDARSTTTGSQVVLDRLGNPEVGGTRGKSSRLRWRWDGASRAGGGAPRSGLGGLALSQPRIQYRSSLACSVP
jgi:hypothetical protein